MRKGLLVSKKTTNRPNQMDLDQNLANHFGVSISAIIIKAEDFGISSLTARVNGVLFDVFFNSKVEITFSCPV